MSDTTPAPAATPEAQAADGQQMEPEQTNSEHAQALSPEQLRAEAGSRPQGGRQLSHEIAPDGEKATSPTPRLNDWPNRVNIAPYTSQSRQSRRRRRIAREIGRYHRSGPGGQRAAHCGHS
jgi:hypothetical protein